MRSMMKLQQPRKLSNLTRKSRTSTGGNMSKKQRERISAALKAYWKSGDGKKRRKMRVRDSIGGYRKMKRIALRNKKRHS